MPDIATGADCCGCRAIAAVSAACKLHHTSLAWGPLLIDTVPILSVQVEALDFALRQKDKDSSSKALEATKGALDAVLAAVL
jgi:hypothetical protein